MSLSWKNFGFIIYENQSCNVLNFNSTENNSTREVDFSWAKTAEAASFSWKKFDLLKNATFSYLKWLKFYTSSALCSKLLKITIFFQTKGWVKWIDLTVAHNKHFWVKKHWMTGSCFKTKVYSKRHIT